MEKKKLRKVLKFLRIFCALNKKEQKHFVRECDEVMICCITEGCFNLLKNRHLNYNKKLRKKIYPIISDFELLCCDETPCEHRREILMSTTGDKVFQLLRVDVLPFLINLLK